MTKTVVIVGALDTKGQEFKFVKDLIEAQGLQTLTVDFGILGEPFYKAEIGRDKVATAGGGDLAVLRSVGIKTKACRRWQMGWPWWFGSCLMMANWTASSAWEDQVEPRLLPAPCVPYR